MTAAREMEGYDVVVVGGGNSAGQAALHLARFASSVTIVVRRPGLEETMSQYLIDEIAYNERIAVLPCTRVVDGGGEGQLEWLCLEDTSTGERTTKAGARPVPAARRRAALRLAAAGRSPATTTASCSPVVTCRATGGSTACPPANLATTRARRLRGRRHPRRVDEAGRGGERRGRVRRAARARATWRLPPRTSRSAELRSCASGGSAPGRETVTAAAAGRVLEHVGHLGAGQGAERLAVVGAEPAPLPQRVDEPGAEGVAGADGVRDRHRASTRPRPGPSRSSQRAPSPPRVTTTAAGPSASSAAADVGRAAARVERLEVLVAGLDQVGDRDHPLDRARRPPGRCR